MSKPCRGRNGETRVRNARSPETNRFVVVTDGKETEKNYLLGLRNALPEQTRKKISLKIIHKPTKDLLEESSRMKLKTPEYQSLWIMMDRDEVPDFDAIIRKAHVEAINVAWSNPCIEVWFQMYWQKVHSYINSASCIADFSRTFKLKTGHEYKKDSENIYGILSGFGDEAKALSYAERLHEAYTRDNPRMKLSEMNPGTTVDVLVSEIRDCL